MSREPQLVLAMIPTEDFRHSTSPLAWPDPSGTQGSAALTSEGEEHLLE